MNKPLCLACNDSGILDDTVYYLFCSLLGRRYCQCPAGEQAFREWYLGAEVQNALKLKRKKEVENAIAFSHLPKRWMEKSLENLCGQEKLKIMIGQYLDNFPRLVPQGKGVYLWSHGSGRGKTHTLIALCREIVKRYACPCIFMTEEAIFARLRKSFENPKVLESACMDRFLETPCLFIDDLGTTKVTAWKNEVLTGILDYRLNHSLATFFSSNFSPMEYQSLVSAHLPVARPERIPSRIYEMCKGFIMEVQGEDWRKRN